MNKEILRVRKTTNLKQLKKYVDEAIKKGAEKICFVHFDSENPYFVFESDFTPEQENEFEINKLKTEFEERLKSLESKKFKTHFFRIAKWNLNGDEINKLVDRFRQMNNIKDCYQPNIKQVITNEYDDFDDDMQTVFITEIIQDKITK